MSVQKITASLLFPLEIEGWAWIYFAWSSAECIPRCCVSVKENATFFFNPYSSEIKSANNNRVHILCSTPKLYCDRQDCPYELLNPPEDCNVNSSLSFTLQVLLPYLKQHALA